MKIYDCFTFYNELELLDLRLHLLAPYVDYFVLVEANVTLRGEPKELFFTKNRKQFVDFSDKIIHLVMRVQEKDTRPNDWSIEKAQRNYIQHGLDNCADDDIVIISDADEILNPKILQNLHNNDLHCKTNLHKLHRIFRKRKDKAAAYVKYMKLLYQYTQDKCINEILWDASIACAQKHYYYFMNYLHPDKWYGSVISLYKNMKTPQTLRNLRRRLPILSNGGWHFAYMGGIDRILAKINSTVDETPNSTQNKKYDEEYVKMQLKRGSLMYGYQNTEENVFSLIKNTAIGIEDIETFARKYPYMFFDETVKM